MGTTLLVAMETNVRNDLKDLDATAYLWATTEIDRHIAHAVADYQQVLPLVAATTITIAADGSGNTRRQSVGSPTGYLYALRAEYPIDHDPPQYVVFREEIIGGGSLYFSIGDPPLAGDSLKVWYAKAHILDNATSTILQEHEELIALGAVAYAGTSATRYAASRLNATGWTPRGLAAFAADRMKEYRAELDRLASVYATAGLPVPQWGQVASDWWKV
jgi:hypothetical protein